MDLTRYDPPAFLTDFNAIPGQLDQWSAAVSGWFDEAISFEEANVLNPGEKCQYYNQLTTQVAGPVYQQAIVWNALPGTFRNRYGRDQALELADHLYPLSQRMDGPGGYFVGGQWENLYYRPQDEYCEWRVTRNPDGGIQRVTFTSEPPEYWQALHGDTLPNISSGAPTFPTTGDRDRLVELYRTFVSPEVVYEDLICPVDLVDSSDPANPFVVYAKGTYNPYNRWNTTDGIMHLCQPANTLGAEIQLGADATILRQKAGRAVTDPDALICCAAFGGPNRTSDPTIGSSVNELAWLGFFLTLRNPVGLYMHHLDMSGFTKPNGAPIEPEYFQVVRGDEKLKLIERAVFEVPAEEGFTVSDLKIGGEPITRGSQIAEHITVNLVAQAAQPGSFKNSPSDCIRRCCEDEENGNYLSYGRLTEPCPPTGRAAFDYPAAGLAPAAAALPPAELTAAPRVARHRARWA
jgi:hypothetical protein